jgi:hypothetical protein
LKKAQKMAVFGTPNNTPVLSLFWQGLKTDPKSNLNYYFCKKGTIKLTKLRFNTKLIYKIKFIKTTILNICIQIDHNVQQCFTNRSINDK